MLSREKRNNRMAEASESAAPESVSEAPTTSPCHIVHDGWTTLSRDVLVDKIKGTIYGQAIGDAIGKCTRTIQSSTFSVLNRFSGLATEFLDKTQAKKYYGKSGPSGYKKIVPDFHRCRYARGCGY